MTKRKYKAASLTTLSGQGGLTYGVAVLASNRLAKEFLAEAAGSCGPVLGMHLLAFCKLLYFFLYFGSYLHLHFLYSLGEPEGYAYPDHLHQSQQNLNLLEKAKA